MAPFPPRVLGPLSECSAQVHLLGQVTGSTVSIFADGVLVAKGEATAPDQWFKLNNGVQLKHGAKVTAVQEVQGESSMPSPDPQIVQARPQHLGYPIYDPRQHLWVGCQCLLLVGMVPGAKVTVQSLGGIFTAQADDGTAIVDRKPLAKDEVMKAHQTACGIDGPINQSVLPEPLPAGFYSTRLKQPLQACQSQITVQQAAEGGYVTIRRQSETLSGCFPISEGLVNLDIPLQENEELNLQVQLPGENGYGDAGRFRVGPQPPEPHIVGQLCTGTTTVLVRGLVRGQRLSLLQNGTSLGYCEAPGDTYQVPVPPLTSGAHLRIEYEFCGVSNTTQREWIVEPAPAFISPPVIPQPLVECAASVHVTGLEPGAHVQLYSKQLGAPIGEVFAISKSHNISIAPALIVGDQITAVQSGCGHTSHSSPVEVQRLGDLPLPTIQPLPTDGARAVSVRDVAPGARVDLYVNDLFAGSAVATSSNVAVPIVEGHPALQINQKVYARQQLCTISKMGQPVTVQPTPPTIESFAAVPPQINQGQSTTLVWRTRNADSAQVYDQNNHLVVSGMPDDNKAVTPQMTTTYTLHALHRHAESRSHPVTVTVNTVSPPPLPPPLQTGTQTIQLFQQTVFEGPIPYVTTYPPVGFLTGNLTQIKIPSPDPGISYVSFIKVRHSTEECNNPDAVVTLRPGESTTPNTLAEIFGVASPAFPVSFIACIGVPQGQPLPTSVAITITYTYTSP